MSRPRKQKRAAENPATRFTSNLSHSAKSTQPYPRLAALSDSYFGLRRYDGFKPVHTVNQQLRYQPPRASRDLVISGPAGSLVLRALQVTAVRIAQVTALALRRHAVLILVRRRGSGKLQLRVFFQAKLVLQNATGNTR